MAQSVPRSKPVVLVVEDQPVLRMMAVDLVEDAGFDAVEACDADEAVRLLADHAGIRIVFTDIEMPDGADGLRLAATISMRWPDVGIVITSGKRTPPAEEIPERGVFFPKPYKPDEVAATLRRLTA